MIVVDRRANDSGHKAAHFHRLGLSRPSAAFCGELGPGRPVSRHGRATWRSWQPFGEEWPAGLPAPAWRVRPGTQVMSPSGHVTKPRGEWLMPRVVVLDGPSHFRKLLVALVPERLLNLSGKRHKTFDVISEAGHSFETSRSRVHGWAHFQMSQVVQMLS
jgi:hypothetical protein